MEVGFYVDDVIEGILNGSEDKPLLIDIVTTIDEKFKTQGLTPENYRWHALVNHLAALIQRVSEKGKLDEMDASMFEDVSPDSLEFAQQIIDKVEKNLQQEEKFLLSIHFETIKTEA